MVGVGLLAGAGAARAAVLWSHAKTILAHTNGAREDILHGAVKPQDATSSSTLYFKFTVNPLSDIVSEQGVNHYLAGLVFYEKGGENLGVGNVCHRGGN
jgi:hypothetical protein